MKTRQGFVSNSSSTSFCIYGIIINNANVEELDEDLMRKIKREDDLYYFTNYESNTIWVGRHLRSIKDSQTLRQFKDDVEHDIKNKLFPDAEHFDIFEESWYG